MHSNDYNNEQSLKQTDNKNMRRTIIGGSHCASGEPVSVTSSPGSSVSAGCLAPTCPLSVATC